MNAPRRTALYEEHVRLGGRMVDFGGWELPVQYKKGIAAEHRACRERAGLFDVSHMGEFLVEGKSAGAFLQWLIPNDVLKMRDGQALYSPLCKEDGGIVDDLLVYRRSKDRFLVVVNASNTGKDWSHFQSQLSRFPERGGLRLEDASAHFTQIAIQGREAAGILQSLVDLPLKEIPTYRFREGKVLGSIPTLIARTGYTGEDGFELYLDWAAGARAWSALLDAGAPRGLEPCGLGARDTLRLEAKLPLYGHELTDDVNPFEAGIGWTVKLEKGEFVGRSALVKAKAAGGTRKLVGLRVLERVIPRQGYALYPSLAGGEPVGAVTSGTLSPTLDHPIALAYVPPFLSALGSRVYLDVRGNRHPAEVVPTPFYKKTYSVEGASP